MRRGALLTLIGAALLSVAGCAKEPGLPADTAGRPVRLSLANGGGEALHCQLMFGHWVERDLGTLEPRASIVLEISQAPADGALYVMRADGQRRMMIETILCGQDSDWQASFGEVDLAPARGLRPSRIAASCDMPAASGRVACPPIRVAP